MDRCSFAACLLAATLFSLGAAAQDHNNVPLASPYAGYQTREIKSLSEEDIDELSRGGGWGLALPAELSGRPGPAHLLELKTELGLSLKQVKELSVLFEEMREEAVAAGLKFIEAEAALSDAFSRADLDDRDLREFVAKAENTRAALRFIHLSRHLLTPDMLTDAQIRKYNALRGYSDDPCKSAPEGHDQQMWQRHNGCG